MQIADIPAKFNIPFADSAGGGFITPIPEASQIGITNGAASLTDGFPPLTFLPVGAGGVPPWGRDFNGILNQITAWNRWNAAGGLPLYDSAFSTAIGGYPKGTILQSTTAGLAWLNMIDDNTSNPDSGGAQWIPLVSARNLQSGTYLYAVGAGTNAITATLAPAITAYTVGMTVQILIANANTAAVTLALNGLSADAVTTLTGIALPANSLRVGMIATFIRHATGWYLVAPGAVVTGTRFMLLNGTTYIEDPGTGAMRFIIVGAEQVRFTSSGVLIGLTTSNVTTDGITLFQDGLIQHSKTSNFVGQMNRNGTDGPVLEFLNGGTSAGIISISGATTTYGTTSDRVLKKNERDFDSGAIIDALDAWLFDWTDESKLGGKSGYGVIAQDAYKVYPQAVLSADDHPEQKYWQVDYSHFVPVLLREAKESRKREAELRAIVADLLERVTKLEKAKASKAKPVATDE